MKIFTMNMLHMENRKNRKIINLEISQTISKKVNYMKLLFITIGSLMLVLSGCGSRSETIASKDYIYRYEELPASAEME